LAVLIFGFWVSEDAVGIYISTAAQLGFIKEFTTKVETYKFSDDRSPNNFLRALMKKFISKSGEWKAALRPLALERLETVLCDTLSDVMGQIADGGQSADSISLTELMKDVVAKMDLNNDKSLSVLQRATELHSEWSEAAKLAYLKEAAKSAIKSESDLKELKNAIDGVRSKVVSGEIAVGEDLMSSMRKVRMYVFKHAVAQIQGDYDADEIEMCFDVARDIDKVPCECFAMCDLCHDDNMWCGSIIAHTPTHIGPEITTMIFGEHAPFK
jgi:hypothetical protein